MTKHFCDICGHEIVGDFYSVSVTTHSTKNYYLFDVLEAVEAGSRDTKRPMYCNKCMDRIANYIRFGMGNSDFMW